MIRSVVVVSLLAANLVTGTVQAAASLPPSQCAQVQVGPEEEVVADWKRHELGLEGWADTAFGVMPEGDGNYKFLSVAALVGGDEGNQSVAVTSGTLDDPVADGVDEMQPVIGLPEGYTYGGGGPIYEDRWSGIVLQMLHLEQNLPGGFYSTLHLGRYDRDTGRTTYLGPLASPTATYEELAERGNMSADVGTPSFQLRDDGYFYVHFPDYSFDENGNYRSTSLSVARATFDDVVNAALNDDVTPWKKYYDGAWESDALGGPSTDLRPGERGAWHPNVVRTAKGGSLLVQGVSPHEMVLADSADGVLKWSGAVSLFSDPDRFNAYPTVVGTGDDPAEVGDEFYVFYLQWNNTDQNWEDAHMLRRLVTCA